MFPVRHVSDLYIVFNSIIEGLTASGTGIFGMKFRMPTRLVLPSREHDKHFVVPLVAATTAHWE
jgi:hypothetical protein